MHSRGQSLHLGLRLGTGLRLGAADETDLLAAAASVTATGPAWAAAEVTAWNSTCASECGRESVQK